MIFVTRKACAVLFVVLIGLAAICGYVSYGVQLSSLQSLLALKDKEIAELKDELGRVKPNSAHVVFPSPELEKQEERRSPPKQHASSDLSYDTLTASERERIDSFEERQLNEYRGKVKLTQTEEGRLRDLMRTKLLKATAGNRISGETGLSYSMNSDELASVLSPDTYEKLNAVEMEEYHAREADRSEKRLFYLSKKLSLSKEKEQLLREALAYADEHYWEEREAEEVTLSESERRQPYQPARYKTKLLLKKAQDFLSDEELNQLAIAQIDWN